MFKVWSNFRICDVSLLLWVALLLLGSIAAQGDYPGACVPVKICNSGHYSHGYVLNYTVGANHCDVSGHTKKLTAGQCHVIHTIAYDAEIQLRLTAWKGLIDHNRGRIVAKARQGKIKCGVKGSLKTSDLKCKYYCDAGGEDCPQPVYNGYL